MIFCVQVDKFVENGVLLDGGKRCVTKGAIGVSELIKITEEEKIELENNFDPIEAPPGPYKVQPDVQGLSAACFGDLCKKFYSQEKFFGFLEPPEWENPQQPRSWQERKATFITRLTVSPS